MAKPARQTAPKAPTVADLQAAVDAARQTVAAMEAAFETATAAYDADPSLVTRDRKIEAEIGRDRARLDVRNLEAELEKAVAGAQAAEIRRFFEETLEERASVEAWLREVYPKLAAEIAEGLARLVAVELRSVEANGRLPPETRPFEELERQVRRPPGSDHAGAIADVVRLPALISGTLNVWPIGSID